MHSSLLYSLMAWCIFFIAADPVALLNILSFCPLVAGCSYSRQHMQVEGHLVTTAVLPQCLRSAGGWWQRPFSQQSILARNWRVNTGVSIDTNKSFAPFRSNRVKVLVEKTPESVLVMLRTVSQMVFLCLKCCAISAYTVQYRWLQYIEQATSCTGVIWLMMVMAYHCAVQ